MTFNGKTQGHQEDGTALEQLHWNSTGTALEQHWLNVDLSSEIVEDA